MPHKTIFFTRRQLVPETVTVTKILMPHTRFIKTLYPFRKRFLWNVTGHERDPHQAGDGQIQWATPSLPPEDKH